MKTFHVHIPKLRLGRIWRAVAVVAAISTTNCFAQISVGPAGSAIESFPTRPGPTNWSTASLPGNANTFNNDGTALDTMDPAVIATAATTISLILSNGGTGTPGTSSNATWSSGSTGFIQTRPTGPAAVLLMATLTNNSGLNIPELTLNYNLATGVDPTNEEVPGHRVYWSLSGDSGSWTVVGTFSTVGAVSIPINLSATPWPQDTKMYILWADDNAVVNTDGAYQIDNFAVSLPNVPPSISQPPVGATNNEYSVVTLTASAIGTAPLAYQWYKNGSPIANATSSTFVVTNTTGSGFAWSRPEDSGSYHVVVTGSVAPPATSTAAQVLIVPDTTLPTMRYAYVQTNADHVALRIVLSEQLSPVSVTDSAEPLYWQITPTAGPGAAASIEAVLYNAASNVLDLIMTNNTLTEGTSYLIEYQNGDLFDRAQTPNAFVAVNVPLWWHDQQLVVMDGVWKYSDLDLAPTGNWWEFGYDDSDTAFWKSGPGPFDAKRVNSTTFCRATSLYNLGPVGTCMLLTNETSLTNVYGYYFRTHFNFNGAVPTNVMLRLNGKFDDGGIIYLNGTELQRLRMPTGAIAHASFTGNAAVGDNDAQDFTVFFPGTLVQSGDNVVAVTVHQNTLSSSDITMGLRIVASTVNPPGPAAPRLRIVPSGTDIQITWSPASGVLQFKDDIGSGAWTDVTPAPTAGGPYTVPASAAKRFYSLRQ